jgi:hypothetical protein
LNRQVFVAGNLAVPILVGLRHDAPHLLWAQGQDQAIGNLQSLLQGEESILVPIYDVPRKLYGGISWLTNKTLAYGGSNRCYPDEVGLR